MFKKKNKKKTETVCHWLKKNPEGIENTWQEKSARIGIEVHNKSVF